MSNEVRVSAPAKINLHLGVGAVRPDGFHPLVTVFQAVGLYDELTLRPADTSSLTVSGEGVEVAAVPTGPSNLVLRAAELLAEHHGRDDLTVGDDRHADAGPHARPPSDRDTHIARDFG